MTIRTICVAQIYDDHKQQWAALDYAISMAAQSGAQLSFCVGVPIFVMPMDYPSALIGEIQQQEDDRRLEAARSRTQAMREKAASEGVTAKIDVFQSVHQSIMDRFAAVSRVHDVMVTHATTGSEEFQAQAIQTLLTESGGPVFIVPEHWRNGFKAARVVAAWDGSMQCARAMRFASHILNGSTDVDLVSVGVDRKRSVAQPLGTVTQHLALHFDQLVKIDLPLLDGNIGKTIQQHAASNEADLVVMGAYGHSRLREWILGGATREMLASAQVPLLMAH